MGSARQKSKRRIKKQRRNKKVEGIFFTSEPVIMIMLTIITVSLIVLGRKLEVPYLSIAVVAYGLGLLVYHTVNLNHTTQTNLSPFYFSIAVDLVILFLGFITYLWIDDIYAKNKNQKSYSDALSWFWDKL